MPDLLELESRRRLYRHIRRNPGKYLRELSRDLDMAMGQLEYHLGALEHAGLISALHDANKRFFPNEVPRGDRRVVARLRQELPRRILLLTLQEGTITRKALTDALSVPRSTLNHHVKALIDDGLLRAGRDGRDAVYQVTTEGDVLRVLTLYQESWLDRMVDAFLEGTGALR